MKIYFCTLIIVGFSLNASAQVSSLSIKSEIESSVKLSQASKSQLAALYAGRGYEPIWVNTQGLNDAAKSLRAAVAKINLHGFPVTDYWPAAVETAFTTPLAPSAQLAQEIALSRVLLVVASNLSVGRVDPSSVSEDVKFEQRTFTGIDKVIQSLATQNFEQLFDSLAPSHDQYLKLKQVLSRLRAIEASGGFAAIRPSGSTLQRGSASPIVRELKVRAKLMGYPITNIDNQFDVELENAIKDIQKANLASPTGKLSPSDKASWEFFSVTSARRIQQVELNMEKFRWLPTSLESRHIFVNLAIQEARLIDPSLSNPLLSVQGVINGRPERKTPSMRDEIKSVVMNPTWTVPPTVFSQDKLPAIQKIQGQGQAALRSWFAQKGFRVLRSSGELDPADIDWLRMSGSNPSVSLQQKPSYDNALGIVKFPMGNPWAIYMHDTNERNLFGSKSNRQLSSGCVRLPKPVDFAAYLLKGTQWTRESIEAILAKPGEIKDKPTQVNLPKEVRLPVYIISITARLGDDGVMRFTQDHYQQNLALLNKLKASGYYRL